MAHRQRGAAQLKTATVFFADILGFTPISERLPPGVVVDLLNRYLEQVGESRGRLERRDRATVMKRPEQTVTLETCPERRSNHPARSVRQSGFGAAA